MGFGKDGRGVIIKNRDVFTFLTLGSVTALKQDSPLVLAEDFRCLKSEHRYTLENATFVSGDGPLMIGICSNELSAAEIAESILPDGPLGRNDRDRYEKATRPVFLFKEKAGGKNVIIPFVPQTAVIGDDTNGYFEGNQAWTYSNPEGFALFVMNMGTGALTTGATMRVFSTYYGVWVT